MSSLCLGCARRGGRQPGCPVCASIVPTPRHQIVRNIIERVGHEYRLAQLAADEQFRADIAGIDDKYQSLIDAKRRCQRRKKRLEQIRKQMEASK